MNIRLNSISELHSQNYCSLIKWLGNYFTIHVHTTVAVVLSPTCMITVCTVYCVLYIAVASELCIQLYGVVTGLNWM